MPFLYTILLSLFFVGCTQNKPQFEGATEGERLNKFFEWSFDTLLERSPMELTYLGVDKRQGELDDISVKYSGETIEIVKTHLDILEDFDRDKLNKNDQLSYDLYKKAAEKQIENYKWRDYGYTINQMFGVQSELPSFMINTHKVKTKKDLDDYISRLQQFKTFFGQVVNQLMRSETQGVVPPKFVFPLVIADSQNIIKGQPFDKSKTQSPLYQDFLEKMKPLKLTKAEQESYKKRVTEALTTSVKPAFENLVTFLKDQETRATKDHGVWKFPEGEEYYKVRLKEATTTDMTPEQIHNLGLKNVERIHKEMLAIAKKVGFKGDLKAFFKHVNKKKFFFKDNKTGKAKYLKTAKTYIGDMRNQLDKLFVTLPKAEIKVKAVEPFREKSAGMAFYQSPSPDGSRPGIYYVNLYNMKTVPKWGAEALAYHEGIPGHHMQISIAQEMEKLPKFRRFSHYTAYIEGWGLYSERVPKEIGFYKDPYSDFGRLSMELTRACRLVVDTGLHWKKWTREQAIAYLDNNLPGDHFDNVRQINRYIVMPGQATAYMVGMLKILDLREKTQKAMGKKFDIKKFHDVILTSGPLPLDILESRVDDMIKAG